MFLRLMTALVLIVSLIGFNTAQAGDSKVIHLTEYNGYFAADETLAGLKAGEYTIIITNKADKLVGFQIQDLETHEQLDMFPLEVGETRTTKVTIGTNGFRYRCPINPTPWYEVSVN